MNGGNAQETAEKNTAGAKHAAARTLVMAAAMVLGAGGAPFAHAGGVNPNGTQGYLGVGLRDVNDEQLGALKLKEARGAEVLSVDHDGPAGKIGLRVHDVILQMNGEVVQGQEQLRRMLHETPAGRTVTLVISRDGQQQTLQTQLANREEVERKAWEDHLTVPQPPATGDLSVESLPPAAGTGGRSGGSPPGSMGFFHGGGSLTGRTHALLSLGGPYTGVVMEPVGAQLAQFFGVSDGTGLLVKNVDTNSPAATAGLRAGDVVIKANQITLSTSGDWSRVLHQSKGQPVALTVMRDKKEQTLSLTPDSKRRSAVEWPFDPGFADLQTIDSGMLTAEVHPLALPDVATVRDALRAQQQALKPQDLQRLMDDAEKSLPNQADLQKMLDDAKRAMPDRVELDRMLREANNLQLHGSDLRLQMNDVQGAFGPGSNLQLELNDLREQMMLSMPGSMD